MTKLSTQDFAQICEKAATHDSIKEGELFIATAQNINPRANTETDAELAALVSGWSEEPMDDQTGFDRSLQLIFENCAENCVEVDTEKYVAMLDDPTLSDAQKHELVGAMSQIITAFVDLGFGVHPIQQAMDQEACGKLAEPVDPVS